MLRDILPQHISPQDILGVGLTAAPGHTDLSDFPKILDAIEATGVPFAELSTYDQDIVVGTRIRAPQLQKLKLACAGRKLDYTLHGPLGINFFDQPFRLQRHFDVFKASIEVAAEVGAIHYVLHSGQSPVIQGPGIEDCYARQREWLQRCGDFAQPLGIYVCVENLFGGHEGKTYASSCTRLAHELSLVNHPFVVATLDVGHAYLHTSFRGLDFLSDIAALAPHAKHIHLHDNFGIADDIWTYAEGEKVAFGHGDLHLPVGWGTIPWADVMRACEFPAGAVFNIELKQRHWHAVQECVDAAWDLADQARVRLPAAAE